MVSSGDHRFWTPRQVEARHGQPAGRFRRPHLTLNNKLMGGGDFAGWPEHNPDYRRGYICGMIRGDGHLGGRTSTPRRPDPGASPLPARPRRPRGPAPHSRLPRASGSDQEFSFRCRSGPPPGRSRRSGRQSRDSVEGHTGAIQWPRSAERGLAQGFLAGIFDAEGAGIACSHLEHRPRIIDWTARLPAPASASTTCVKDRIEGERPAVRPLSSGGLRERCVSSTT